jgi:[acyl-carrier-protein] S-malonyltransferase
MDVFIQYLQNKGKKMTRLACVFPGQGSQTLGMLAELAAQNPQVEHVFAQASAALGYDLWDVIQNDPKQQLNQTHVTQPALLAASVAVWQVLPQASKDKVTFLAGHSLGEYSALVCAGVIDFADALRLVEARGQFMQQAVPEGIGAMYAIIGLDDAKVIQACAAAEAESNEVVSAVNFNSPGQVVIAGNAAAVNKAGELCKAAGAKRALPLSVSVPSHCALMKPAAEQLAAMLHSMSFSTPMIPVINNVDVANCTDTTQIKDALVRQLYMPVRWTESVEHLVSQGVNTIYEIGPGKVLAGLIKRIDKSVVCESINTPNSLASIKI